MQKHGLGMGMAINAFMDDTAGIWGAKMRISFATWIPDIPDVIMFVISIWVRKVIQDFGKVVDIAQFFPGADQIFFVFVHPNAGSGVVGLDGYCSGNHPSFFDESLNFLG